jgi:hypothetical protein
VSQVALLMLLDGNRDALVAYRDKGIRGKWDVIAEYYRRCGLSDLLQRPAPSPPQNSPARRPLSKQVRPPPVARVVTDSDPELTQSVRRGRLRKCSSREHTWNRAIW